MGYSPRFYTQNEQQVLEQDITSSFVGAELCGCIKITQFLMAGGYGRGEYTHACTRAHLALPSGQLHVQS